GIARVAVYRDPMGNETQQVWIGDATFVEGVRPDVAAAFPGYPHNTRAGWGLSVLSNLLPNAGNGRITFHAYAAIGSFDLDTTTLTNGIHTLEWRVTDSAGNVQGIGSRYFYVQNGG
ncbi:MAG: hypothetical protein M3468_06500, partial [Acidobacteriota bacterium]|nr:hypothetical protein [Acidobacteriota bacterium]